MNPTVTTWESLLPAIKNRYNVEQVDLSDWIKELESIENPSPEEISSKPAIKLLDFYRALQAGEGEGALSTPLQVTKSKEASKTMETMGPISVEMMENWLDQWDY